MDFGFTDEQEAFWAALREFGAKELAPHYRADDVAARMRPELPAAMAGMGLTGLRIPERFGGQDADAVTTGMAAAGGVVRLPRIVGPRLATEMILTGRRLGASEALDAGLVNRVVGAGTALDGARELADGILAGSPTSVRLSLRMMAEADGVADTVEAAAAPSSALDELMLRADTIEGLTAFAEKRAPVWRNR